MVGAPLRSIRIAKRGQLSTAIVGQFRAGDARKNTGSGHWIPTGMPSKQIVLEVSTAWGSFVRSERFIFGRRIVVVVVQRCFHVTVVRNCI